MNLCSRCNSRCDDIDEAQYLIQTLLGWILISDVLAIKAELWNLVSLWIFELTDFSLDFGIEIGWFCLLCPIIIVYGAWHMLIYPYMVFPITSYSITSSLSHALCCDILGEKCTWFITIVLMFSCEGWILIWHMLDFGIFTHGLFSLHNTPS